ANVQVGNPPTQYQLIVDTGSSNTFVGANKQYARTSSSHDTGNQVAVSYGSGSFSGEEFVDDVALGTATITQSIGAASNSTGFNGLDGILGLGPDDLTEGTTSNGGTVPTVTDNLAKQGKAASALVGVSIPLTTNGGGNAGSLDFGTPDTTKFNGNLKFVPVTHTSPSSQFWGIDQSITYGNTKLPILKATSGIVDTGTTLLYMATDAFNAYVSATGATVDPTTGLLTVKDKAKLQSLFFNMGENTFEFTANAQIFPSSLNTAIGGNSGTTYLIVQDIGTNSGQGLDFINGFTFLQRFYSVFDTPNQQVGFATTPQTTATSN
ncbi:aspartic peptidase domain-containing protein, partial [Gautieria morchelliformis]